MRSRACEQHNISWTVMLAMLARASPHRHSGAQIILPYTSHNPLHITSIRNVSLAGGLVALERPSTALRGRKDPLTGTLPLDFNRRAGGPVRHKLSCRCLGLAPI